MYKRAKILATLGPASSSPEKIRGLIEAGVDAIRINCSHAKLEGLAQDVKLIRRAAESAGRPISILMDLQGPRLRTGRLRNGQPVPLQPGKKVMICLHDIPGTDEVISTNYRELPRVVKKGGRILLDDGTIELKVLRTSPDEVECEVLVGGMLKEHKGLNVPGAQIGLPALTAKDKRDLEWGMKLAVDFIALSFVKCAEDVEKAKHAIKEAGSHAMVIAKIERADALDQIKPILDAADGLMVARGDLAVELSAPEVPVIQKQLVHMAQQNAKMVIVATQMLESMISHQQPTRAEASDVANAIFDGTDAVMLSGETAVGLYPQVTVRTMADIIHKAERSPFTRLDLPRIQENNGFAHALSRAAVAACAESQAKAIVVFTLTGWSAKVMAKYRPPVPIYAMTPNPRVLQQLGLVWGVIPLICPLSAHTDTMIQKGEEILLKSTKLKTGDTVIVMAGGTAKHRASNTIKIQTLGQ